MTAEERYIFKCSQTENYTKENLKKIAIETAEEYLTEFVNHQEFDKQKLFNYMKQEHNIVLMDSEMNDIREIVLPHKYPYTVTVMGKFFQANVNYPSPKDRRASEDKHTL